MRRIVAVCVTMLASALACAQPLALPVAAPQLDYRVVARYPHDATAFTEGLLVHDDTLVESTGLYGRSQLFVRDLRSGKLLRSLRLPASEFGEGAAVVGDRLYQLTWREGVGHIYDRRLRKLADFSFTGEGWGLTFDGTDLIRSDGSATLHFHDPADFREKRTLVVRDAGQPVVLLNELEYVDGWLYANVWMSDRIAVIDPGTGTVSGWLDLADLHRQFEPPAGWNPRDDVLNGIAWDARSGHLLVTGKRWPMLFELAVGEAGRPAAKP